MADLTVDVLKTVLPANLRRNVDQDMVDRINKTITDPEVREAFRENLLSYTSVLSQGKFKLQNYIDAVKYVSYKLMGDSNITAYSKAFPDKIQRFTQQGVSSKDIASYVTAYNKSKLVNLIMEQTLVPTWVLNQDLYQKALNVQAELMMSANSEKVRCDAANSLINALKRPETHKVELDLGVKEDSVIESLRASTMALVNQQKEMLKAGFMNAQEVAHSRIIEGEATHVSDPE
jgi:hypothetical protein